MFLLVWAACGSQSISAIPTSVAGLTGSACTTISTPALPSNVNFGVSGHVTVPEYKSYAAMPAPGTATFQASADKLSLTVDLPLVLGSFTYHLEQHAEVAGGAVKSSHRVEQANFPGCCQVDATAAADATTMDTATLIQQLRTMPGDGSCEITGRAGGLDVRATVTTSARPDGSTVRTAKVVGMPAVEELSVMVGPDGEALRQIVLDGAMGTGKLHLTFTPK
jgi:hypothetical protein